MPLSDADRSSLRDFVPNDPPDDSELDDRYDALGSWQAVAVSYLRRYYFALLPDPAQLTVPGQISYNQGANLAAFRDALKVLGADVPEDAEGGNVEIRKVVRVGHSRR